MIKLREPKTLELCFFASGIYDTIGGFRFTFMVGTDRNINNTPTHPFYAIFIASFLFCFAYLQFLSAFNIRQYVLIIDGVLLGKIFYAVLLFAYMFFVPDFQARSSLQGL